MKILTLFLALFLTLWPESAPVVNCTQGQEVCLEVVDDVEEEAVIRTPQRTRETVLSFTGIHPVVSRPVSGQTLTFQPIRFCLERQWLAIRRLLL